MAFGDDGITIHEHPDGNFTIDVGSERCIVDPERFREFVHRLAMIGRQKGWVFEQPVEVSYALPKEREDTEQHDGDPQGTLPDGGGDGADEGRQRKQKGHAHG